MRISYPSHIPDNDEHYFLLLEALINSIDDNSICIVTPTPSSYLFRISPSEPLYTTPLIHSLNEMHNKMNIRVEYSKSIKKTSNIVWKLDI